jgi:acetyl esterase/lipase
LLSRRRVLLVALASVLILVAAAGAWVAARPVRLLNALALLGSHQTATGLAYGSEPRQRFDLYQPDAASPAASPGAVPLVVFVYGGSWNRGERADYRFVGEALARRGVAVAVIDYRLYPEVTYPAFLEDVAKAVDHALAHAAAWGADPQRVFLMGHSAGAYNVAMMALDPRWLAAVGRRPAELAGWVGLAGPYDFLPIREADVKPVFHHPDVPLDSQPIVHAREARAPLPAFLAAPLEDTLVNPKRSTAQMAATLTERGGAVTLRRYGALDHVTIIGAFAWPVDRRAPVREEVLDFLRRTPSAEKPADAASGQAGKITLP